MESEKTEQYKAALKLAGALAQAANRVINSNPKSLSCNIVVMEATLYEYNNYILQLSEKTYTKSN